MDNSAVRRRARLWSVLAVEFALLTAAGAVAWWASVATAGPSGPDYVEIAEAAEVVPDPPSAPGAATGTYSWSCGLGHHRNADNMVASPGQPGAARHVHDYVGNVAAGAQSTDDSLAAAGTTCENGDGSVYYWPVLRSGDPRDGGEIQVPVSVTLTYRGNPAGQVVAMPRFLRASTGNARAVTSGGALARPTWTCTSAPTRRTSRYPICPAGDRVLRIFDYPNCWDGRRTDSPDHRSHTAFATPNGRCPHGTFPVPQLRIEIAYQLPADARFTIDTIPEQRNSPLTDHADLINVMPEALMAEVVRCLNTGLACRSGN